MTGVSSVSLRGWHTVVMKKMEVYRPGEIMNMVSWGMEQQRIALYQRKKYFIL